MATVKRFEELEIWQLSRIQCAAVFNLIQNGRFMNDRALEDQINRSSGSVMDNIAEGFDRFSRAEFRQALVIARGSNAEVRSQLYRAADRHLIAEEESKKLLDASSRIGIKIHNLIQHLQQSNFKEKPTGNKPDKISESEVSYDSYSYELPETFFMGS